MKILCRKIAYTGFIVSSTAIPGHPAQAMSGPQGIQIEGGPLGSLSLSGGVDGYVYGQTGTSDKDTGGSLLGDRSNGVNLANSLADLQKSSGVLQFNIEVGATLGSPVLGFAPPKANLNTFRTGPLVAGYLTIAPSGSPVTVSVGQLSSLEGYEALMDYLNANTFASSLYAVENDNSPGVSATYTHGPISATVTYGDGWNTGVFNFLQGLASYSFNNNNSLSLYYAGNLGRTGLNALTFGMCGDSRCTVAEYGPYFMNSQMFGGYFSWTHSNLNLTGVAQYVYAKPDQQIGIGKFTSNFGVELISDYSFGTSPWSIAGLANYFTSNGAGDWYLAPRAAGLALEITPTWQYKDLFARISTAWVHLDNTSVYGNGGTGQNAVQSALEAGVLF